jgi:hypothetical protein
MFAYLDPGSGAALATVIASGAVGASALVGRLRQKAAGRLGGRRASSTATSTTATSDGDGSSTTDPS